MTIKRERSSGFGIELFLVIALPVAVIIAGVVTMVLAFDDGFTPLPEAQTFVNPR